MASSWSDPERRDSFSRGGVHEVGVRSLQRCGTNKQRQRQDLSFFAPINPDDFSPPHIEPDPQKSSVTLDCLPDTESSEQL